MIRLRLITLAALAVVAGAFSAGASGVTPIIVLAALAVLGVIYAVQTRRILINLLRVVLALLVFCLGFSMTRTALRSSVPGQLPADTSTVQGITLAPSTIQSTGGMSLELSVTDANGSHLARPVTITVQMSDRRSSYAVGQPLRVTGTISDFTPPLNPGEQRLGTPKTELFLAKDIQVVQGHSLIWWWGQLTKRVRDLVELRARPLLNYKAFGFLEELLLHRKLFDVADRQLFSMTGTSHLLAISGLHLSLIFAVMSLLLGLVFSEKSVSRMLAPLAATFLYLAFIDFPLSADRAFAMLAVLTATRLLGGHLSKLAALSWAALVITLLDPVSVFDIGLQLSFASVAGLFFIGEPLAKLVQPKGRLVRGLVSSLAATVGASLPTTALVMATFHIVAPVALIANIVAIPVVSLLLTGLLAWSTLLLLVRPLAALLAPLINGLSTILIGFLRLLSQLPGSHSNVSAPRPLLLATLALFFGVLILSADNWTRMRHLRHPSAPLAVAAMLVVLTWSLGTVSYDMRVTFPFVEQGNVVLIQSKNMGTWLCLFDTDAKAANRAVHAVASLGVNTPDVVVIAGSPADLPDQLDSLFGLLSPGRVYIPATAAHAPIAGLPQRFQSIVVAVRSNEAVSVSTQAGSMQAKDAAASGPSFLIATSALAGKAARDATLLTPSAIPNFAYDTSTNLVTIRTNSSASRFSLQQTGCISVFTRGSRCWVALDPRR